MITPRTPQRCLRKAVYVYRTIVNASERNDSKIVRQTNTQTRSLKYTKLTPRFKTVKN